jgi:methylthioribose-1-phosphate isomerase
MKLVHSPLFEPVLWEGNGFKILNEISIPEKIEYIEVREITQALNAVREMKTRAFGQVLTFLYSAALLASEYEGKEPEPLRAQLAQMTQRFCAARPTFDFKGIAGFFSKWLHGWPADVPLGGWVADQARGLGAQIVKARQARAKRTAAILPHPARVMTHCNVSGELVAVAQYCKELGKDLSVIATETRPYLQGSRLTAWELSQAGVSVSLVPDCAIAQVMGRGEVNAVVVGSDRCAQNGDIVNKVGTYPLALMAKNYNIPFYALVQDPGRLASGDEVTIEERGGDELLEFQGRPLVAEGAEKLAGRYPAFDITPASLLTSLIGFDDLYTPESFRERFLKDSPAPAKRANTAPEKYLLVFGVPRRDAYDFLKHALKAEQANRILVPEMRPELWGARIVAPELLRRNVPTTLISDNMMGILFARGEIRQLYLFYSGLSQTGPQGICGSLLAVRLARAHGVPTELQECAEVAEAPLDRDVSSFLGQRVIPDGVSIYPLEKEIIPWEFFQDPQGADA